MPATSTKDIYVLLQSFEAEQFASFNLTVTLFFSVAGGVRIMVHNHTREFVSLRFTDIHI